MDKEPHRREPLEYAATGQEYASPGHEYASPGLEQQGKRTRANDYASPRQEKNRSEREKLLRTMLLGTATVAIAAAAVGANLQPDEGELRWVVTGVTDLFYDENRPKYNCEVESRGRPGAVSPDGYSDAFWSEHLEMYSSLEDAIIQDMDYLKEESGDNAYYYDAERDLMVLPRPCIFTYYAADDPDEYIFTGTHIMEKYFNSRSVLYIVPDMVERGATLVVRVDYPLGNDYYRDEYQYNLATGEFTQTMDGQWTMQFDKYYDTKPVSEVHQSTAAESE